MNEKDLGLELFLSEGIPGIGGKLRKTPDDFVVDEISIRPSETKDGRYVIARVWHRNWEANRLARRLASNLHVGRGRVGFAGTKDGRSVATQLMSFDAPIDAVRSLAVPDVEIKEAFESNRMISIGDLVGNKFAITVRDLDEDVDARAICHKVSDRLGQVGGFPNFFGIQRFGSVRPITHLIGKDLVSGDVERAVMRYIANPLDEDSEINEARRDLEKTRDFERALSTYPRKLAFERTMIGHLKDHPDDYIGALRRLPANLLMMFVHAYQSYMFNRILSERMRRGHSIAEPEVGDLVLPLDKLGIPDHDNPILVTQGNLDKAARMAREKKAFVSGLLYGSESSYADGAMGEIEKKVVESEGVVGSDFQIVGLREASSKGSRRELLSIHKDLDIEHGPDWVKFSFSLNKGCYATSLMREFMKTGIRQY